MWKPKRQWAFVNDGDGFTGGEKPFRAVRIGRGAGSDEDGVVMGGFHNGDWCFGSEQRQDRRF
jgi:hypothetical protein